MFTALYEMMKIALSIIVSLISSMALAAEFTTPPPVELMLLPFKKVYEGEPQKGHHGEKRYCYRIAGIYTIYTENLLGDGYSFSKEAPAQECVTSRSQINTSNRLGLTIGITQEEAGALLGVSLSEGVNRIQWHYQRPIHNLPYDDLTTLDIEVKNGVVHAVSIFNTVTH